MAKTFKLPKANTKKFYVGYTESQRAYDDRRGTRQERGYGAGWQRIRLAVLNQEPLCRVCQGIATEVDHILPRADGGGYEIENLQGICKPCHSKKTVQDVKVRHSKALQNPQTRQGF